jgi:ketosteroid isomerase-like protein
MMTMFAGLAAPILATLMLLPGQETTTREQDVVKAWDDWRWARVARDRAALDRVLAEEFLFINPEGRLHPRAEYLGLVTRDETRITTIHGEEHQVRIYGDTAVLTGFVIVKKLEILGKEAADPPLRTTAVFVWRDGRWQAAMLQATRIGPCPEVAPGHHAASAPSSPPRLEGIRETGR